MEAYEELFKIARELDGVSSVGELEDISRPLEAMENAGHEVRRSFSGAWLGYHSRVYYAGLKAAPPGAHFSQEWGLKELFSDMGSVGDWRQFDAEAVKAHLHQKAGEPDVSVSQEAAEHAVAEFSSSKSEIMSILENELVGQMDGFLTKLKSDLDQLEPMFTFEVAQHWAPKGQMMTRDTLALGQGTQIPPHVRSIGRGRSYPSCFRDL